MRGTTSLFGGLGILFVGCVSAWAGPVVTGTDDGSTAHVKRFDPPPTETQSFLPYGAFSGGVRVAAGDLNGDGVADTVTGSGPGTSHVKVFDGVSTAEIRSFLAFPAFSGGIYVASGDITGDNRGDIVVGAGPGGGSHVVAFDGQTLATEASFFAYGSFSGGVRVASGDVNNDGFADIVTGTGPGASHVKVFDGQSLTEIRSFFAYNPSSPQGVYVAAGDVNGDNFAEVITGPGDGASGEVQVYDGASGLLLSSFFAYGAGFSGGVRVATGDVNNDGQIDIITGTGPGTVAHVKAFDGTSLGQLASFFAYGTYTGGAFVAGATVVPEPGVLALLSAAPLLALRRRRGR